MTELAIRQESAVELHAPAAPTANIARLSDWAAEARAAAQLAASLCKTSFVPDHFRDKPEETTAAILTGHELGLSPMAALRAIYVFKGTPGIYAKTMVAVLLSQGHEVWVESQSDDSVTVCGRRKGTTHVNRCTWDRARVVKAKLTNNAKYQENPQQMLYARAASEACRETAPDALLGMPYAVEEIEDFDDRPIRAEVVSVPRVTAAEILGTDPAPVVEPPIESGPPVEWLSEAQMKKLHIELNEHGMADRDKGLAFISLTLGRDVDTTKMLTKQDAMVVIDKLMGMPRPAKDAES